jgi:anti-sigma factor RsiW
VTKHDRPDHLSAERQQAYLDGDIPAPDAAVVEAHVASCARCRSQLEAWQTLFEDLSDLPSWSPSPVFRERILETLPAPAAARVTRVRGWLGLTAPVSEHVSSSRLQEYLDRRLRGRTAARVEAHLDSCAPCRLELDSFRALSTALGKLPALEPTEVLSERVMAELRIQQLAAAALAPTSRRERVAAWMRGAVPRTPRGWAAALGTAVAPAATVVLLARAVFSNPLVTLDNLAAFGWLKGSDAAGRVVETLGGPALESSFMAQAWSVLGQALESSAATAGLAALLSGLTLGALWILYRNVIASHPEDGGYAHLSI